MNIKIFTIKAKLILLFTLLHLVAFTQSEWASLGAEWYYNYREGVQTPNCGYYHIKSVKDTIIETKPCKVLYKTLTHSNGNSVFQGADYIYTDTIENKVYRYLYGSFYLLYDFSKEAGDTLIIKEPYDNNSYDSITVIVDSVGYENYPGGIRLKSIYIKRMWDYLDLSDLEFSGKVVERIGNLTFFFPYHSLDCDGGCPQPLRCYNDDKIDLKLSELPCDNLYSSYKGLIIDSDIKIYPNPFKDVFSIEYTSNSVKPFSVELINSTGQKVFRDLLFNGYKRKVDLSVYPNGIFFLKLINEENEVIKKLIKL